MFRKLVLIALLVVLPQLAHAQPPLPIIIEPYELPEIGVGVLYEWRELGARLVYVAGPNDSGSIHFMGAQNGIAGPEFKRTTLGQIEITVLPTNGFVAAAFEIQIVRNIDLARNIDIGDGFSLRDFANLLEAPDQLTEMFGQLARNVVEILEARDYTCHGTISDNSVLTLSCGQQL